MVVSGINYGLSLAEGVIEGLAYGLNQKMANGNYDMLVGVRGLNADLNLTTPRAPSMSADTDLIQVWLDGRFVDSSTMQPLEPVNAVEPVRTTTKPAQFDQIFVHESMIDSLLFDLYTMDKKITPNAALKK